MKRFKAQDYLTGEYFTIFIRRSYPNSKRPQQGRIMSWNEDMSRIVPLVQRALCRYQGRRLGKGQKEDLRILEYQLSQSNYTRKEVSVIFKKGLEITRSLVL